MKTTKKEDENENDDKEERVSRIFLDCLDEYRKNIADDRSATQKASVNVTSKLK